MNSSVKNGWNSKFIYVMYILPPTKKSQKKMPTSNTLRFWLNWSEIWLGHWNFYKIPQVIYCAAKGEECCRARQPHSWESWKWPTQGSDVNKMATRNLGSLVLPWQHQVNNTHQSSFVETKEINWDLQQPNKPPNKKKPLVGNFLVLLLTFAPCPSCSVVKWAGRRPIPSSFLKTEG